MANRTPTIPELYLAFRQAKSALYFEKRGVGLLQLAEYENNLQENLRSLQAKLRNGSWFDRLDIGNVWVVPKRFRSVVDSDDQPTLIGGTNAKRVPRPIDIQLRLSPNPDYAIAEVLYLWRFGGLLERLLSRDVLGYRLDLRGGKLLPHRRWIFEYWPKRYQQFRNDPLRAAQQNLKAGEITLIASADLANFYDTIDPEFMLEEAMTSELSELSDHPGSMDEYLLATRSLLNSYRRFHSAASSRAATKIEIGIPIGALTSRVVANLSLVPLDQAIASQPDVICYRRYVDDIVIVSRGDGKASVSEIIRQLMPIADRTAKNGTMLRLNTAQLGRAGSEFELQEKKIKIHRLVGEPGEDFIDAVASDFAKALSERRAFIDTSVVVGDGVSHLIRAGNAQGSPLRVLREADRTRLERFSLSTSLRSLERVSSLIRPEEARQLVRTCLERVGRVLNSEDNWVDDLDVTLRLLKLAISTEDWKSASELRRRTDRVWASDATLRAATENLFYRGRKIDGARVSPWKALRDYLHERRLEAICSTLPINWNTKRIERKFPDGLLWKTKTIKATGLRRRAELLASADLRARDREDDADRTEDLFPVNHEWMRAQLTRDKQLSQRLRNIKQFVDRCEILGDRAWAMPAARLFLCTRPPSYFDISRRWLSHAEASGFHSSIFDELIEVVNAIRGTGYVDAVCDVISPDTISITPPPSSHPETGNETADPRIILGNLCVGNAEWIGAAMRAGGRYGKPVLTMARLQGVNQVLEKASLAARRNAIDLLVLPELSLPRKWFRSISNHVVKNGRYGLVTGLEYIHHPSSPYVFNQVYAVLPGPCMSVATWPWTKRLPAREEAKQLATMKPPVSFAPLSTPSRRRTVVHSNWGSFSVLICSELIESRRISDLLRRVELVLCPAWNPDTASYDHLIQSVGFQLHAVIAIANNGVYSDCRAWAPRTVRWQRDLCRLIERGVNDIVHFDLPLSALSAFHGGLGHSPQELDHLKACLERRDISGARKELERLMKDAPGEWRPLPPDWS